MSAIFVVNLSDYFVLFKLQIMSKFTAKTIRALAIGSLAAVALCALPSCDKGLGNLEVVLDKDIPYQNVFVTVQGERVQGSPDSTGIHEHSIYLKFAKASNFANARIELEETPGYKCIYPEDLNSVDIASNGVLIFSTPRGQKVKYFFNVDCSSRVIADASKISVEMASDVAISINDLASSITIPYNPAKMKNSSIHLVFRDGALEEGVKIVGAPKSTYLDFTSSLKVSLKFQKITDEYQGERVFDVNLSVASLLTDYARFGFSDKSLNYVSGEDAEHIKVYQTEALTNVPVRNYNPETGEYYPETPFDWQLEVPVDTIPVFGMPGDWKSDRKVEDFPNETTADLLVTVVLIDPEYVTGRVVVNDSHVSYAGQLPGLVTMSGMSSYDQSYAWADGKILCGSATDVAATMEKYDVFRSAFAFTKDGQFQIATGVWEYSTTPSKCKWYKWTEGYSNPKNLSEARKVSSKILLQSATAWDASSVITSVPCHCMTGRLLTNLQVLAGDISHGTAAFGSAWNGTRRRAFVGITYDNKIALATFYSAKSQHCIGSSQASWLLNKLGWRDIMQIGTEFYMDDNYNPTIKVNDVLATGTANSPSFYSIVFDKK